MSNNLLFPAAPEAHGGPHPPLPSPEQPDIRSHQPPPLRRRRRGPSGARAVLPAAASSVTP